MATNNFQQNEMKLRKIVEAIGIEKEELDESMTETKYIIEVYSRILYDNLPDTRNTLSGTPLTTYSVLQVMHNN